MEGERRGDGLGIEVIRKARMKMRGRRKENEGLGREQVECKEEEMGVGREVEGKEEARKQEDEMK
jgi:hypothetical protein